jgi:TctA family transporter
MDGQFLSSLAQLLGSPQLLFLILLAVPIGMVFGAVPGLGGKLAIAMMIPFVFGMDMLEGGVFLVALHAVVHTGGSLPSILLGIPGTGPDAATVVDGHPMTLNGEAGRALGASLAASGLGGVIGAVTLALLLPVLEPLVLAFGSAEIFMLAVFGITFVAALSGDRLREGLIVGLLGLVFASVGMDPVSGVTRFTFGQLSLWEGLDLITVVLGLFAVPEMLDMALGREGRQSARLEPVRYRLQEVLAGMREVLRHRWLALRTSVIGAVIGMIPGLGGDVSAWLCYGHAVQSSKTPERFGKGAVEGVIAPETANNSKEGGALVPTLFFGVPGSSGMVLLLAGFVMLGITPGPELMVKQPGLLWILVWALVLANLIAVLMFLPLAAPLGRVTQVRAPLLVPLVLVLALLGSYLSSGHWQQLLVLALVGVLGLALKRLEWPRAPFVIGLVLGPIAEVSLHRAWSIWGAEMFQRPLVAVLAVMTLASLAVYVWRHRQRAR